MPKKKNDAYAICTAQKKKSGMGHDEWKRCVKKLQKKESVMNFYERVAKLINEVETGSGDLPGRDATGSVRRTQREPTEADIEREKAETERLRQHHFGDKKKVNASKKSKPKKKK